MKNPIVRFVIRWFVCGLGLWITAELLSNRLSYNDSLRVIIIAGFLLALLNIILKPFLVILSLPALVFSLGLFMIIINGLLVVLASKLYPQLHVTNFWAAMLAGMVIGLVNYLVTTALQKV